jgi:ferredoxin
MKVRVDPTKCQGFGACAQECPGVFELDEWGYAQVRAGGAVPDGQEEQAQRAVDACPEHAISSE